MSKHRQNNKRPSAPQIVTYQIPKIEVYQVTDAELTSMETSHGQVGQDFTIAVTSLSLGVAFVLALLTGTFQPAWETTIKILTAMCGFSFIYTGIRWWRTRNVLPRVITEIRSRKVPDDILPPPPTRAKS